MLNVLKFPPVLIVVAAAVVGLGRLATILGSELFPDEALYVWISHVDPFGFAPHPPGVPALVRAGMLLLGRSEEGVRLASFLLATLTPVPVYLLARETAGRDAALWTVLAVLCVPIYSAIGSIATPDAPQLFLWALALLLTWKALATRRLVWWGAAGVALGTGLLIKYILILYVPSLFLCLLLAPRWRPLLRTPGPWLTLLVAFTLFAPAFFLNQAATGWNAVRYHLDDRQSFILPSPVSFAVYHGLHLVYVSPLLYGLSLVAMVWAGREGLRRRDERLLFLFSFSAVMWAFFAVISLVTKRELSREQWDAPAYIPALITAALYLREKASAAATPRRWRRLSLGAPLLGLAIYALVTAEGLTGHVTALFGKAPLYANFRGWQAMAEAADKALEAFPPGSSPSFFLGNAFMEAQQFEFYSRTPHRSVRALCLDNDASERFGITSLLVRQKVNQGALAGIAPGTHAVFAMVSTIDPGEKEPRRDRRRAKLERLFERVEALPEGEVALGGRPARRITLYRCLSLKPEARWSESAPRP